MQIKAIMRHFAFLKEIFFGLGDFFTWSFQVLPPIGILMNWILVAILVGLLTFWCLQIVKYGTTSDKRAVDFREPHNFID